MAIKILMPALSPTMTEGNLAKWLKKEGDIIKPGEVIAEIETDKATMEVEASDAGILGKILIPEKTEAVKVNSLIAVLLEKGEKISDAESLIALHNQNNLSHKDSIHKEKVSDSKMNISFKEELETKSTTQSPNVSKAAVEIEINPTKRIFASPLARKVAADMNIDLSRINGSGPRGRIIRDDVIHAQRSNDVMIGRNDVEYSAMPMTQMRKTIAKRLQESKNTIPHFYLSVDCDLTELNKARNYLNNKKDNIDIKISVNDFVIKAAAMALQKVPNANVGWIDDAVVKFNNIDISVAVAYEGGLITPIVFNANQKTLQQISSEVKELATKAKNNQLKPQEFTGGSFTISNLGMYGVKEFSAIINPPQACILAVGAAYDRAIVKNGQMAVAPIMTVTISCDHRSVDGALAAVLMQEFKMHIEQPVTMFL